MKICPNCSARNYDNAEVCFNCRTPLANVPVYPDPVSQQQPVMNPYMQQPFPQDPNNMPFPGQVPAYNPVQQQIQKGKRKTKNKAKKNTPLIVFAVVAGLLLIAGGIAFFLLNSRQEKYKDAYEILQKTVLAESLRETSQAIVAGNNSDDPDLEVTSETPEMSGNIPVTRLSEPSDPTAKPKSGIEYLPLQLKQKFDLEDVDIQINSVQWGEEIRPSNTSGYYNYYSDNDGEKFFYLLGTVKNNKGKNIDIDYGLKVRFVFNDKYTYTATIVGEEKDGTGFWNFETTVNPLEKKTFLIYRSVPDEVKNIFDHCVVTIGYNDDFSTVRYDDFEEMDKVYQLYVR